MDEIIDYGNGVYEFAVSSKYIAIMNEVGDSATMFDDTPDSPMKLPGKLANRYRGYVPWGNDNKLPYEVMQKIRQDEVMSQNKQFNTVTSYASGIQVSRKNGEEITDPEIYDFFKYSRMAHYFGEQCADMKHFLFSISVIILSKDGKKIVKLRHKEAIDTRFETCDPKTGKIEHLYIANWEGGTPKEDEIEIISVLDIADPIGDLEERMDRKDKERKFAIVNKFPVVGNKYYPFPYYCSVFLSGWYDIKRMIPAGKKAKLKNQSGIKYHVEVNRDYWDSICREEKITDPELKAARIKKERENIKNFCTGIENSGKVWISGFYQDPNGNETRMVRINLVDSTKEGGDWLEDSEEAANLICYADNIHPNLVGAALGKSKNNMSGTDKRELFTIKQALEKPYHDILLEPLFIIKEFNGWTDFKYDVPVITLTTLDKGKDAEENTLRKEE